MEKINGRWSSIWIKYRKWYFSIWYFWWAWRSRKLGQEVATYAKNHFVEILKSTPQFKSGNYGQALSETFLNIDTKLPSAEGKSKLDEYSKNSPKTSMAAMMRNGNSEIANTTGCTACVALITKNKIFVANSGDSRAVLCKGGKAFDMSEDHKPENPKEKARIEKAKGFVEDNRVNGVLNLSRSLGDLEYKKNPDLKPHEQLVISQPDIKEEEIKADADFLIIACDGIWDCLTSQKACDYVKDKISKASPSKSSQKLGSIIETMLDSILATDVASSQGIGCDNMSCIIVQFKK